MGVIRLDPILETFFMGDDTTEMAGKHWRQNQVSVDHSCYDECILSLWGREDFLLLRAMERPLYMSIEGLQEDISDVRRERESVLPFRRI